MKQLSKKQLPKLKYLLVGLAVALVIVLWVVLGRALFSGSNGDDKGKPAKASSPTAACDDLYNEAKKQVVTLSGYEVVTDGKRCQAVEDEIRQTDHKLAAYFRLKQTAAPTDTTEATVRANVNSLIAQLPVRDYTLQVQNEAVGADGLQTYCVFTSRYLNNDMTYIPQSYETGRGRYTVLGNNDNYYSPCVVAIQKL
jgi:hypothetical protein